MTSLSTHVLDTERGCPAGGVPVTLFRGDQVLAHAETNADGRIPDLGASLDAGVYRLDFDVAAYFTAQGRAAAFLQSCSLDFRVDSADAHYHVPLLLAPYAFSCYRGS